MEDRNGGLQLDLSTCDVYETKENVQMDKEKFCVEINLQVCECVFPVISVSLTGAAVPVTEGDNIMADWNKNHCMPICAANPISSSSDGMA